MGRGIAANSPSRRLRAVTLTVGVTILIAGAVTLAASLSLNTLRQDRISGVGLYFTDESTPDSEVTNVTAKSDSLNDSRSYQVVYLDQLSESSPAPPGIPDRIRDGDVYLSPALHEMDHSVADRYGRFTGLIAPAGLADRGELLVYVGDEFRPSVEAVPLTTEDSAPPHAIEWSPHGSLIGQDFYPSLIPVVIVVAVLIPATWLTVVAARVGDGPRGKRMAVLSTLGAKRSDHVMVSIAESAVPLAIGATLVSGLLAMFLTTDVRLPYVEYWVFAKDVRTSALILVGAVVAGMMAATWIATTGSYSRMSGRNKRTRPDVRQRVRFGLLWVGLFAAALIFSVIAPEYFRGGAQYYTSVWGTTLALIVLLPLAVTATCALVARRALRSGAHDRDPSRTIVFRRIRFRPKSFGRPLAVVAMSGFLTVMLGTYAGLLADSGMEARKWLDNASLTTMTVYGADLKTHGDLAGIREKLPESTDIALLHITGDDTPNPEVPRDVEIFMDCDIVTCQEDLGNQGMDGFLDSLPNRELAAALSDQLEFHSTLGSVRIADLEETGLGEYYPNIFVYSTNGDALKDSKVTRAFSVLPGGAQVSHPVQNAKLGAIPTLEQSRWLTGLGAIGVLIMSLAVLTAFGHSFRETGRQLAPLSVMTGDRRVYRSYSRLAVGIPISVALIGGIAVANLASIPMQTHGGTVVPYYFTAILVALNLVIAASMTKWSERIALRERDAWRP
ncbi:hypothetical protein [Haloglycomyces albus]|uniref:hypothetical protein n=1 Tax=Haloglycomyces albus TaxID=526067 RepID=UPI0012EC62B1|nr:hypothetical protein [Haloglycomyces albus]